MTDNLAKENEQLKQRLSQYEADPNRLTVSQLKTLIKFCAMPERKGICEEALSSQEIADAKALAKADLVGCYLDGGIVPFKHWGALPQGRELLGRLRRDA